MPYAPFLFKSIDKHFMKSFLKDVGTRLQKKQEAVMSPDNVLQFQHGRHWDTPANELGDKSGEIKEMSTLSELPLKDVVAGNPMAIFRSAEGISKEMHEQMMAVMIQAVSASTENSGNVINSSGRPIQETFLEMLEAMPLPLDESGEISMPSMVLHLSVVI